MKLTKVARIWKKHGGLVLTVIGATGVVSTALFAIDAAPRANALLEELAEKKGEDLTIVEKTKAVAPIYIPTVISGTTAIFCICMAHRMEKQTQAALSGLYSLTNSQFREYKQKVREEVGEEKEIDIRNKIASDHVDSSEIPLGDKILFFEEYTGRKFESTMAEVRNAEYHLNRNFSLGKSVSLNELYAFIGIPETPLGEQIGWDETFVEGGIYWIDFEHRRVELEDGKVYVIISCPFGPEIGEFDPILRWP